MCKKNGLLCLAFLVHGYQAFQRFEYFTETFQLQLDLQIISLLIFKNVKKSNNIIMKRDIPMEFDHRVSE